MRAEYESTADRLARATGGYDFIGDIHGHANELEALLDRLGYTPDASGVYRSDRGRKAVFLGDFIDRGPEIRRVLQTVRAMTDAGEAIAVIGNHEMNALRYHARNRHGEPLRAHSEKNRRQHAETLRQIADPFPEEWESWLAWFAGLPVFLDFGAVRAVHAAWDPEAIRVAAGVARWEGEALERFSLRSSPEFRLLGHLLNGPEILLPEGASAADTQGMSRREIRVKWWRNLSGTTFREAVFPDSDAVPGVALSGQLPFPGYPAGDPPVLFGHYALRTGVPEILTPNVACADYGMGKGGFLCAYRWNGENELSPLNFLRA